MATYNCLDIDGLRRYDTKIKNVISEESAKSLKCFQFDTDTNTLKFYKSESPSGTPDLTLTLPEQDLTGLLRKISGGTKDNIVIIGEGGTIVDSGVTVSSLETKITANSNVIDTLTGTGPESIDKKIADAVATIVSDAPEAYDTLKEMSDWIGSHEGDAAIMNSQINTNKTNIETLSSKVSTLEEITYTPITNAEIDALFEKS